MNDYILKILKDIMAIDSPSGFTKEVIQYCQQEAKSLGYETSKTKKGNLEIKIDGKDDYTIGFCAHVDTLGLMVRSIKNDGTLAFTNIGGPIIPTLDGEYCKIYIREIKECIQELFFRIHLRLMYMKMPRMLLEIVILCTFV